MPGIKWWTSMDSSGFKKGGKEVESTVQKMDAKVSALGKRMAGAFTFGAALGFQKKMSEYSREVTKMSELTGLSTDSVQAMTLSLQKYGLELNDVANGPMRDFAEMRARGINNEKTEVELWKALGVSVEDLRTKKPEEIFEKLAVAYADAEGQGKSLAAVYGILGSDLSELNLFLKELASEGMDGFIKKYDEMSGIMSEESLSFWQKLGGAIKQNFTKSMNEAGDSIGRFLTKMGKVAKRGYLVFGEGLTPEAAAQSIKDEEAQEALLKKKQADAKKAADIKRQEKADADALKKTETERADTIKGQEKELDAIREKRRQDGMSTAGKMVEAENKLHTLLADRAKLTDEIKINESKIAEEGLRDQITSLEAIAKKEKETRDQRKQDAIDQKVQARETRDARIAGISVSDPLTNAVRSIGGRLGGGGDRSLQIAERNIQIQEAQKEFLAAIQQNTAKINRMGDMPS